MLDFAIDLAYRAGTLIRAGAERDVSYEPKQYADVVTEVDRASEALIVGAIRARYPDHAIIAEEGSGVSMSSPYTWLIDPLDGTLNFLHGLPIFCVSIALLAYNEPLLGVVYDPMRNELFYAERGRGAFLNGRRLRVSQTPTLARSLLSSGLPYDRFEQPDNNLAELTHLAMLVQDIRRPGSAALDLCAVAAGRTDGHWELGLKPWDVGAGGLIALEAGATVTDWQGEPWRPLGGDRLVATNGLIHADLLAALAEVRRQRSLKLS